MNTTQPQPEKVAAPETPQNNADNVCITPERRVSEIIAQRDQLREQLDQHQAQLVRVATQAARLLDALKRITAACDAPNKSAAQGAERWNSRMNAKSVISSIEQPETDEPEAHTDPEDRQDLRDDGRSFGYGESYSERNT